MTSVRWDGSRFRWVVLSVWMACVGCRSSHLHTPPSSVTERATEHKGLIVGMRRTGCDGLCPVYDVHVYDDGCVVYGGMEHVEVVGRRDSQLTGEQVGRLRRILAEHVRAAEVYGDEYGSFFTCPHGVIGFAGVVLTAPEVGVVNPVCYAEFISKGETPLLGGVDYLIDELLGTSRWIGCATGVKGYGGC
ncbi:DUF6438 domain-containing protein [Myxococcus llanfairpwllgwyngyllgogerychwyrndrobwllllantysiliogogogochensis]|nr:DUF6438 domain-containing protein [Myxococcus llanfairpwllgwyngyllgogerychwyrndrobwllllantysiliogogogochensis]